MDNDKQVVVGVLLLSVSLGWWIWGHVGGFGE